MVAGHQIASLIGLEERSQRSFSEQFFQASITCLQIGVGSALSHMMTGHKIKAAEVRLEREFKIYLEPHSNSQNASLLTMHSQRARFTAEQLNAFTRENLLLELIKIKRRSEESIEGLVRKLQESGLTRFRDGEIDEYLLSASSHLDKACNRWGWFGAHYINLSRMNPNHKIQSLEQLAYAQRHLQFHTGETVTEKQYAQRIRWGVFLANHRDALALPEPYLLADLSDTVVERCRLGRDLSPAGEILDERVRDFVYLTRWAFHTLHHGKKSSTSSDRIRDVIDHGTFPLQNHRGRGTLVDFFNQWVSFVDPAWGENRSLVNLYECTFINLKGWHRRIDGKTPETQDLIRNLRASVLKNYRGDLPLSVAREKHPIHRSIEEGEIPLHNTGSLTLVEIYDTYSRLLREANHPKEEAEDLIRNAIRAERKAQKLWQESPKNTVPEVESLRADFDEALLARYRGSLPKKGEGALSDKNPLRDFHERGIFPIQHKPGLRVRDMMTQMMTLALGDVPAASERSQWENKIRLAIDAAQGWSKVREGMSGQLRSLHQIVCEEWIEMHGASPPSIGNHSLPLAHPLRRFVVQGNIGRAFTSRQRHEVRATFRNSLIQLLQKRLGENTEAMIDSALEEIAVD